MSPISEECIEKVWRSQQVNDTPVQIPQLVVESHSVRRSLADALDLTSEPFSCLLFNT